MRNWCMVAVLGVFLTGAQAASAATTRVVDDDGNATAANCNASGAVAQTIQAAVNASAPAGGDTVKVCPGIYSEQVVVNKPLALDGPQAGADARSRTGAVGGEAVVNGSGPSGAHTTAFNVTASNVTIDGFVAQDNGNSVNLGFNVLLGAGLSGETFQNNIVRDGIAGLSLGS